MSNNFDKVGMYDTLSKMFYKSNLVGMPDNVNSMPQAPPGFGPLHQQMRSEMLSVGKQRLDSPEAYFQYDKATNIIGEYQQDSERVYLVLFRSKASKFIKVAICEAKIPELVRIFRQPQGNNTLNHV